MKNFLAVLGLLVAVSAFLGGCHNPPEFPNEPSISYKRVEQYHFTVAGRPQDSLRIVIRFEDGDGDLGLTSDDNQPPFNPAYETPAGEKIPQGEYFYNYFVTMYIKRNGVFQVFQFPNAGGLNSRFFPLAPDGRVGPLEGDLKYTVKFDSKNFTIGDVVKFDVYIVDKKLNKSNRITTDEITLFK
jgi:hypothetical protein